MEAARQAVKDFMTRAGHHDTTVHERVAPAVTHETITKTRHENLTTAVQREVHQDHYHTSVQPVLDEETLAEQHHHNLIPVEHRKFHHGDDEEVKRRLAEEAAKYKDEVTRVEGKRTSTVVPIVTGEHIHHHVHETIQPVINKQTIEPHIIHTTIPIHEVHHNAAHHHATSALPAVSMADFKKQGGVLTGREERKDGFAGEPRSVGKALGGESRIAAQEAPDDGATSDLASVSTAAPSAAIAESSFPPPPPPPLTQTPQSPSSSSALQQEQEPQPTSTSSSSPQRRQSQADPQYQSPYPIPPRRTSTVPASSSSLAGDRPSSTAANASTSPQSNRTSSSPSPEQPFPLARPPTLIPISTYAEKHPAGSAIAAMRSESTGEK